ncbi:uncharacterized protein ARMOST_20571 [Armillaria ostoyae]|uniref:Uncharacterized protein n=1 Tax=Armillaria ostoyae TaxID=47428 RepID=A0A284S7S7_ARMOS|nr:uncharacterized protein ARMOST_20571 [Armillaria ostoyae]
MLSIRIPDICEDSSSSPNHQVVSTEKVRLCGALHPHYDGFITSPNSDNIPAPPPNDCPFSLRSDFRLGAVDPIQAPQMIDSKNLFYATIPSCPMDNDVAHPYIKYKYMWTNATDKDIVFAEGNRTLSGVATLSEHFCRRLHSAVKYAVERSEETREPPVEPWKFGLRSQYLDYLTKRPNLLQRIVKDGPLLMSMGIHRLETLKLDPGTILLTVGMIQSLWIELCGALDYIQFFRDAVEPGSKVLNRAHGSSRPALCHLMGGFTTSEHNSKLFSRAGIPVYLIRPLSTLPDREVLDTVGLTYLPIEIEPTILDSSQHLDRFLELTGDCAPPAINSWFHANAVKVNRFSAKSQQYKRLPSDANYFFPDPHLFLDVSDRERVTYLHMWKQIGAIWKYRASCNRPDARPLSSEEWRDLLGIPLKASTESEIQKHVEAFLGPSPDSDGVSYHLNASDFDLPIEKKEALELVWEICELNFRFELLSLDVRAAARSLRSQATGDEYFQADSTFRIERQTKVRWCFPDAFPSPQSARANYGISSTHWSRRFKKLKYLRKLMEGWANPPRREVMAIRPEALEKESRVSVEWEQGLVQHYVQTFYDHFGRPAILPRRLLSE